MPLEKRDVSATAWPFIVTDEAGIGRIEGTRTKVIEVALDHLAYGWDADQIHRQYPSLSLPQIHAALGYYYEHREECDRQIDAARRRTEELLKQLADPALQERLRRLKAAT